MICNADFHAVISVCAQWHASDERRTSCLSVALQSKHGSFSKWQKLVASFDGQLPTYWSRLFITLSILFWNLLSEPHLPRWDFYNNRISHMQAKSQFATGLLLSSRRLWWTARGLENSRRAGWRDLSFAGWLRSVGEAEHNQLPERSPGQISVSTIIKWPYTCWE